MKKTSILILCILLVALAGFLAPAASFAAAPDRTVADADKLVQEARQTKSDAQREIKYGQAVDLYQGVIKKYPDTVDAAQAKYDLARVYETSKSTFIHKKEKRAGKYDNPNESITLYTDLIADYDKPVSELKKEFTPEESATLKGIADQAKDQRNRLIAKLNKENSHKWQYKLMDALVAFTGRKPGFSYWFAVILLTVAVKIVITPLTKAQFKSMKEMQKIQPLLKDLQEKYKNDQKTLQTEMMKLYKEHGVNPFASCLPLIIQMPILIGLYSIISVYRYQFEKGGFLWIGSSLSHSFQVLVPFANKVVYFSAANLSEPDLLLVLLYLVSMFVSQRISIVDPTQAEQQKVMSWMFPIMFGFLFAGFPSAFLLYWLVFNILQTAQQYVIIREGQHEAPAGGAPGGPSAPPQPPTPPSGGREAGRITRRTPQQRSRPRRRRR